MAAQKTLMRSAALLLALVPLSAARPGGQDDVPMQAMKDELARSTRELRLLQMEKPYFIAYRMDEVAGIGISATLGSPTSVQPVRARRISVELRVGDYALDNSNYLSGGGFGGAGPEGLPGIAQAPLDDDYQQIRRQLWLATDAQYKKALEDLSAKRAALRMRKRTEEIPDFSRETPLTEVGAREKTSIRSSELEALVRELSAVFKTMPDIHGSSVRLEQYDVYTRYLNSEGSSFTRSSPTIKLLVRAETQAPSALPISDSIEVRGRSPVDLPPRETLLARVRDMAARMLALRSSSSLERYNGPVLFESVAAAEVFSQQLAPGMIAIRQPMSDHPGFDAFFKQMMASLGSGFFAEKIGGRVLPEFLGVTDNPLQLDYKGTPLLGASRFDDDAVTTRETKLVEHGTLKTLLATRDPVRSILRSTGSRRGWGAAPSNLLVASDRSKSGSQMRQELLRLAQARGLDYAVVVRHVGGGAAASLLRTASRMAGRAGVGSSALAEVYKLYPDGREELLQGVELAEMTPAAFKDIVAVGDAPAVFADEFMGGVASIFSFGPAAIANGPPVVSYVVPALLFEDVSLVRSRGPFPNLPLSRSPLETP